jgi:hypothetical protein
VTHPNTKWVSDNTVSASDRVPIQETHFGCQERHNLNMSIISPEDPFAEIILFWVSLLEKIKKEY